MKKLILAMTLFYALLTPCFSQKMTEKACRYLKNKISEETEMESFAMNKIPYVELSIEL